MKRILILSFILYGLLLTACNATSIGVIGGADGPTAIYVGKKGGSIDESFGEQYEKRTVHMFNVDGVLYYDSGIESDVKSRCGVMDGSLNRTGRDNEIPHNPGEANFETEGYQNATSITKEVNIDGEWIVFKRFETAGQLPQNLKYCHYIKGRLNNAATDSELIVLSEKESITFGDVYAPMLSSQSDAGAKVGLVTYNRFNNDKWGIRLFADNVTARGLTLKIEQFGGNATGELHTGAAYKIEKMVDDGWQDAERKIDNPTWNDIAYIIQKNEITEMQVNWEFLYGVLSPGYYRISKKITNFRAVGDHGEETYQAHFTVE
ncbi:MAG: hypothetical protein IKW06_03535 [Clostridia bacterium]|nr:hypothetical protein [Clostridia bacterium]